MGYAVTLAKTGRLLPPFDFTNQMLIRSAGPNRRWYTPDDFVYPTDVMLARREMKELFAKLKKKFAGTVGGAPSTLTDAQRISLLTRWVSLPPDPWGEDYVWRLAPGKDVSFPERVYLVCAGPDFRLGTADDIRFPD